MKTCFYCGSLVKEKEDESPYKKIITFRDNKNIISSANAIPFDDAFYKILDGKRKGNFVHIFDIIK